MIGPIAWLTQPYHSEPVEGSRMLYTIVLHKGSPAYYAFLAREVVKYAARQARRWWAR